MFKSQIGEIESTGILAAVTRFGSKVTGARMLCSAVAAVSCEVQGALTDPPTPALTEKKLPTQLGKRDVAWRQSSFAVLDRHPTGGKFPSLRSTSTGFRILPKPDLQAPRSTGKHRSYAPPTKGLCLRQGHRHISLLRHLSQ